MFYLPSSLLFGHHLGLVFKVNFDSLSGVPKPIKPSTLFPNAFLGNFSVSGFSQKNSPLPYIPDLLNLVFALVVILQKSHSLHFGIISSPPSSCTPCSGSYCCIRCLLSLTASDRSGGRIQSAHPLCRYCVYRFYIFLPWSAPFFRFW